MSYVQGACVEPLAVARAAVRRSGARPGERCLVIGAGSQGLLVSMFLQASGAVPVVTDIHEGRLALAQTLGMETLDGEDTFPRIFETSGSSAGLLKGIELSTSFTQLTLLGISDAPLPLSMKTTVRRQLTITGSLIYDHPTDFRETIALIGQGAVRPELIIKAEYALDEAASAFAAARRVPGKTVIHVSD
jgi:alcohol dehydrogenase/L-iditol 2-dehydrogenase